MNIGIRILCILFALLAFSLAALFFYGMVTSTAEDSMKGPACLLAGLVSTGYGLAFIIMMLPGVHPRQTKCEVCKAYIATFGPPEVCPQCKQSMLEVVCKYEIDGTLIE